MQQTIERYRNYNGDAQIASRFVQQNMQHLKQEIGSMMKKMELLEVSKRRLLGQDLGSCSLEELQEIEQHLENTVEKVRARKNHVFKEQLEQLTEKDKALREENARLSKYIQPKQATQNESENQTNLGNNPTSYVETDLFIGLPDTRTRRIPPPQV